jgi:hypothetical protein
MENQRMSKVLEFATALNISRKTVWAHIYAGKLAVVRIGRQCVSSKANWIGFSTQLKYPKVVVHAAR